MKKKSRLVLTGWRRHSGRTGRNFSFYLSVFGLNPKKLKNKKVLDVGSGFSDFAWKARESGIKAFKLDPNLDPKEIKEGEKRFAVRGTAEQLPFKAKSFHEIVSSYAIPFYSKSELHLKKSVFEMLRTTKKTIRLYPITTTIVPSHAGYFPQELIEQLKKSGFGVKIEKPEAEEKIAREKNRFQSFCLTIERKKGSDLRKLEKMWFKQQEKN